MTRESTLNGYKMHFGKMWYNVNKKKGTIVSIIQYYVYNCDDNWNMYKRTVTGVAKASPKEFDIETGKKLARARAEKAAYQEYKEYIIKQLKMNNIEKEALVDRLNRVNGYIEHQKEYIKTF